MFLFEIHSKRFFLKAIKDHSADYGSVEKTNLSVDGRNQFGAHFEQRFLFVNPFQIWAGCLKHNTQKKSINT